MEVTAVAISLLCQSCGCRGGRQGWAAFIPQHGLVPRAGVVPISAHLSLGKPPPCPGAYIFSADVWLGIVVEVRGLGAIGVLVWSLWQGWELLPRKDSAAIHMRGILSGGRANLVGTLQKPGPA